MASTLQVILKRLKKPSVVVSIISEISTILLLLNINVDPNVLTGVSTSVLSIMVLLGIISNPDSKKKGYGDDSHFCTNCNKTTLHVEIAGKMHCKDCGTVLKN